ncbi:MAG: SRPBCC family protein [Sandaracinaceae bacterium]|nr:SRPBCC family protein [Sandaracinaceae bacterium]MDW8246430.1 SRPBCC family protein [Sandaracinaceae bacterium]
MTQAEFEIALTFALPRERLWEAIVDHVSMSKWLGVSVRLLEKGDQNGVGALRRVRFGPLHFDEEVVYSDPPIRLVYRWLGPWWLIHHRGEVLLSEAKGEKNQSELRWRARFVGRDPVLAPLFAKVIELALRRGLKELKGLLGG